VLLLAGETTNVDVFLEGMMRGLASVRVFVTVMVRVYAELFRSTQNAPPSTFEVVVAGRVSALKSATVML
jgi:hypothetical protein